MKTKIAGLTQYKQKVINLVTKLVAAEFSINEKELFVKSRATKHSIPRKVAAGILRKVYNIQYQMIADYYGYRSHASVGYAVRSLDKALVEDVEISQIITNVMKNVKKELQK